MDQDNGELTGKAKGWFKPGQSGNPKGRTKVPDQVKDLAREHTFEAIATLARIMKDRTAPHSAQVRAAESLLDRAWGKAEATVSVHTPNDVREISTAEILAALVATGTVAAQPSADGAREVH